MESRPDPRVPVRPSAPIVLALVVAVSHMAIAGASPPPIGPAADLAGPPNGDLSAGLEGWGRVGPSMVLAGGPVIEASDNTTVLSPSFTVPPGAQSLSVSLGVPGANAIVDIRARPVEGGPDIALATVVPDRAVRGWDVPIALLVGRAVRIVIDPVTSLGRRLYVRSVGPVRSVLPGWDVRGGVPVVSPAWGRPGIRAVEGALSLGTPPIRPAPGTRFIGLAVRGTGTVRATIGARGAMARATSTRWTALHVPIGIGARAVRLAVTATPAGGGMLALADVGVSVRRVRITVAGIARSGRGAIVRARVGPGARGLAGRVMIGRRTVGAGTVRAGGSLVIRTSAAGSPATLVVAGDASHLTARAPIALPG